jgi:hypothetical protein
MQNILFMKGHTYTSRFVRAVMPEARDEILLEPSHNLLVEMSDMHHPSKEYTYPLNRVIFVNHGGTAVIWLKLSLNLLV